MRIAVIIPAYNEGAVIGQVLQGFKQELPKLASRVRVEMLVIDDGSTDNTRTVARAAGARVVSHVMNLGLGGAISTGLKLAHDEGFDAAMTIDSDGQHLPKDLRAMLMKLSQKKCDFVVGSRWIDPLMSKDVPLHRRLGNIYIMNGLTYLFTGFKTTDSQSGLRGFSRTAVEKILIAPQRMEVSTEFFSQAKRHNLSYCEIPIHAVYTDYSMNKGQRTINGLSIIWRLTIRRLLS